MPSASRVALLLLVVPVVLAGCSTTQETSARLKIRADRILASREPVEVGSASADVRVLDAAVLREGGRAAVAVTLRNESDRPLNDLPVTVGIESAAGTVIVNRGHSLRYFETHTPGLAPRSTSTWVFEAPAKKVPAGEPEVRVGDAADPPTVAGALPELEVSPPSGKAGVVTARVANRGGFPQYELVVYAWAKRGGRFVAAARKSIGDLRTEETDAVRLNLIGDPGKAEVHVAAPPTIFE